MQNASLASVFSTAALALASVLAAPSAHAVEYVGARFAAPATGNAVVSYGSGDAQSFDIDFGTMTRVTLAFVTFRDEAAPSMSFSALINNFTGYNFEGLNVRLTGGAVFQSPSGSVIPTFGTLAGTVVTPTQVAMSFSPGELRQPAGRGRCVELDDRLLGRRIRRHLWPERHRRAGAWHLRNVAGRPGADRHHGASPPALNLRQGGLRRRVIIRPCFRFPKTCSGPMAPWSPPSVRGVRG
jgi:hypothetical protein